MAISNVKIANLALVALGADRIMAITEASENARKINEIYEFIRDEVLSSHPWNFAIKRDTLAQLSATPAFGYTYYHQRPSDCLRILDVYYDTSESSRLLDYKIEGDRILSDYTSLYIKYIYRNDDPTKYSMTFASAFASRLAAELAYPITNSTTLGKAMLDIYNDKLRMARGFDAQESGKTEKLEEDQWLESRF